MGDKKTENQDQGKAETGSQTPEGAKKNGVKPAVEARIKMSNIHDTIEVERKAKLDRQQTIKKDVATFKTTEGWRSLQATEGMTAGFAKDLINSTVEEKFGEYLSMIQENGLGDPTNLGILKQAAKDLIYEHYTKTGNNKDTTTNYVQNELGEKLKYLFNTLKGIYDSKKYAFTKPVDCIEAFSNFADLGMISNGALQLENLKKGLVIERSGYEKIVRGFQVYMDLDVDISKLNSKKVEAVAKSEKKDALELLKEKKIQLNAIPKVEIGGPEMAQKIAEGKGMDEVIKMLYLSAIMGKIPDNVDQQSKEKICNWLIAESVKITRQPNEGLRLKEDGTWEKFELPPPAAAPTETTTPADTSAEDIAKMLSETKTGNSKLDKLLAAIGGFFSKIGKKSSDATKQGGFFGTILGVLAPIMGIKMEQQAGGKPLEDIKKVLREAASAGNEIPQDSEDMAKGVLKIKMDIENFKKLAMDKESLKKVTDAKKAANLAWDAFLEKQLTTDEKTSLEKDKNLTKEKIVEMLLSRV